MSEIRNTGRFAAWSALVAVICLLNIGMLRAQEIRVVAQPNQSVRMGRGGYICEGQLTATPVDPNEPWSDEMVQCTGPIYNSYDYAALHAKQNHDELVKLNDTMDRLSRISQQALDRQAQELNRDLKANIEQSFQGLPHNVLTSADVQNLKKSLLEYVDQRVIPGTSPLPARPPRSRAQPGTPPGAASPPRQP